MCVPLPASHTVSIIHRPACLRCAFCVLRLSARLRSFTRSRSVPLLHTTPHHTPPPASPSVHRSVTHLISSHLQLTHPFHTHPLPPTQAKLKSEEPSAEDLAKPVKVIKGSTFKKEVVDSKKDVLLEFYAPWWCVPCGLCGRLPALGRVISCCDP